MSEEIVNRRFPIGRERYIQRSGKLLEHRLGQIFQELGFGTEIAKGQENGLDIRVFQNRSLVIAGEICNWSVRSSLNLKRKDNIINNLTGYSCKKVLFYTCLENEVTLADLPSYGIDLIKLDNQILPRYFYDFYAHKNQIVSRRIDSRETRQDIMSKLLEYLQSINLLPQATVVVTGPLV